MKNNAYGFGKDWTLRTDTGKDIYLGQDAKVCSRILGCRPSDLIQMISERTGLTYNESRDIESTTQNECLAEIIAEQVFSKENPYEES